MTSKVEGVTLKSYIRQFGDLDQPLEVHHISGFIEEGLEAAGQRATESSTAQIHLKNSSMCDSDHISEYFNNFLSVLFLVALLVCFL